MTIDLSTWRDVIDTASGARDCPACLGLGVLGLSGKLSHAHIAMASMREVSLGADPREVAALHTATRDPRGAKPCIACRGSGLDVPAEGLRAWLEALRSEAFAAFLPELVKHLPDGFDLANAEVNATDLVDLPFESLVTLRGPEVRAVFEAYVLGRQTAERLVLATAGLTNDLEED